ncbi:nSTAND3 domain-containing NTPase [Flindersiella endophytica]
MTIVPEYDFAILSPQDFELLTRDILNAEYSLRLVSHPAGRDQGIDLRGESGSGERIVVQCKHYANSRWPDLQAAVRKETKRRQQPEFDRYVFVTSQPLTAHRRDWIIEEFGHVGFDLTLNDVWGLDDLNEALGRHPEVERRHFKLWLASANVLETFLNAGRRQRGEDLLDRAAHHSKVWVPVPEFDEARRLLKEHGVCVLAGPPGAGKSMLAQMLVLESAREGWDLLSVSSNIEEAWQGFREETKQVIYHDDFLGDIELELAKGESAQLVRFIDRVRLQRGSKRLVLTTREQIFRRAMDVDDRISWLGSQPGVGVVRLAGYPAPVRAHVLFNHLYFSALNATERAKLAVDNRLLTAVDHPSYNPRLVEHVTAEITELSTADDVTERLLAVLADPRELWHATFRRMDPLRHDILLALVTLPNSGCSVEALHALVDVPDAVAWTPALRELEPTWLRLLGQGPRAHVVLANPGCADYLLTVLDDAAVAGDVLAKVRRLDQYVELTSMSGVLHGAANRPNLAYVLKQRREQIMEHARELATPADVDDVVLLAGSHGSEHNTGWVFDLVEHHRPEGSTPTCLRLAERLNDVPAGDLARRVRLVQALVTEGLAAARTIQDLDAYEAFPASLLPDGAQDRMRERAQGIIRAELDYLTYHSDDPEILTADAHALRQRAGSYDLDLDIAPLLDRADDLVHNNNPVSEPELPPGDDDPAAIFRHLAG